MAAPPPGVSVAKPDEASAPALILPDSPSIAALPFQNWSGDPEQEYFADGVVEDIITALSRIRWLFVIARNSSFTYKGRAVDVKQVGRELGVRYVLEGSVRKAANRVRITGQLDRRDNRRASLGRPLRRLARRHLRIAGPGRRACRRRDHAEAGARRDRARQAQADRKPAMPMTIICAAWRIFIREPDKPSARRCRSSSRAIELDPSFASAYGMAASCYYWRKMNNWMSDRSQEFAEGARLANRAVELGKDDAVALSRGGHAFAHFGGDLDRGVAAVDRALELNPNLSAAWFLSGFQRISLGEHDDASRALRPRHASEPAGSGDFSDADRNGDGAHVCPPL